MQTEINTASLLFVKSKNPPVFHTPLEVYYRYAPKVGESFFFSYRGFHACNLSEVKKITKFDGFIVIQTRNSYYVLTYCKCVETENETFTKGCPLHG